MTRTPRSDWERRRLRERRRGQVLGCAMMTGTAIIVVFLLWLMISLAIELFR